VHKKNIFLLFALLWTTAITVLSLISLGSIGDSIPVANKDKYVHFIFYFVFVFLWMHYINQIKVSVKNHIIVLLSAILYGITMEIVQGYTERTPDIMDVLANSIGALSGLICSLLFTLKTKTKTTH